MHLLYRISRCTYSSNAVNEPLAFSLSTSSTNDLFHCTRIPDTAAFCATDGTATASSWAIPGQGTATSWKDTFHHRHLSLCSGRTHFTIVTCCSVPLHPPLFKHSNHPFCSFFRVFRNKTLTNLLHLNTRCQWNKLLWPGYFLPAFYAVHEHNSSVDEQYMQYLSKIRIIPPQLCTSFYITVEN